MSKTIRRAGGLARSKKTFAVAAVAACAATGRPTLAQSGHDANVVRTPSAEQLSVRRFHIVAGPLTTALEAYRRQSGVELHLTIAPAQLDGLETQGLAGHYTSELALRELLAGTGLSVRFNSPTRATIGLERHDSVDVSAALPQGTNMNRFTETLLDTPQTVDVVPQFVLKDQANRTLMDAVRNVPGISLAAGESGAQGDNLTIRGFTARNDIFLDGIRDFGSYYRDSFDFEQVEVLEGPAGVEFGRGSTGGVINQESKVPTSDKFTAVETSFGTDATRRVTADINQPLPDLPGGAAFRLNVMAEEGGVAGRPYAENRRLGLAPSISFGMNGATRLTVNYFHFTESDTPDYGLPWFFSQLAPGVNRHAYFGFPDANYLKTSDDILTAKVSHQFTPDVEAHMTARWANYPRQVDITEPQICSNPKASVPVGGWVSSLPTSAVDSSQPCPYSFDTPPSQVVVNRNQLNVKSVEGDLWDQTELTAHFNVAGIRNELAAGVEGGQEISNPIRTSYVESGVNSVPSTSLTDPNPHDVFGGTGYISSITHTKAKSADAYFIDTVKFDRFIEIAGGVRWDYFNTLYKLYSPATSVVGAKPTNAPGVVTLLSQTVRKPSYRATLVLKPSPHGSVYFDYGTSFNPSGESLSLNTSTSDLAPEENETYEAGIKWNFLRERLQLEGAVFRTEKDNAREPSPTDSTVDVLAGNQLVKGMQASAVGRLAGGVDLVLGYAYLDSAVIKSIAYPTSVGYPLANVPKQTFNAFVTHNLPLRLNLGLGGNYVGARTASSTVPYVPTSFGPATSFARGSAPCGATTNCYQVLATARRQVPGYWVFNAMLKRPVTDHLELQANVYNLLNRFYIDQPHPSHLIPGAGLSALVQAQWRW